MQLRVSMNTTSPSLLERLRQPEKREAWSRFVNLYTPLLYYWARRAGLPSHDAADLVQEVLLVLVQKLPEFKYDPDKSFRGWLRTILLNKWRERCRRYAALPAQASESGLSDVAIIVEPEFEEAEYRQELIRRALEIMQSEFEPTTWKACWEFVVSGRPAVEVAGELGVSVEVVYSAKSRVLRRLREELAGLLD
jgi:RNA polymerase sigma-70 factor (ECF subfamily)